MNIQSFHIGKVILAGAGPGDPELLTLKTLRWLQQAEVVVVDRLVSPEMVSGYVRPQAIVIPVGKQCGKEGSTPQAEINELLIAHALEGRLVVRLKGGDVSIFSNVLDELEALTQNGIPYEIVPGVTAALGAAAYAGIPLTARGYSTAVRFLTGCRPVTDVSWWRDLAQTEDTLVLYMSSAPLDEIVSQFVGNGIASDRWIAVIEQATTPMQRVHSWPVQEYLASAGGSRYASPTLVIIGRVAALHSSFQWLANSRSKELYFPPINKNIAVC
ncbi:MAG TPA: uroporphyrinogen-III C-methyltransferase [Puia sp.]|jgi:uroporphyrin-III C-methyltransferase/precorrin-2 dehydrogenase/sirohydrochlorin ferrochelatase/uroporphyrin-III C-methyltransferase|uniref:uroporphyrinogen-III C-methyltransferase n=1 Tax=Puia sp. TaxID=2045100 RepID=UPI002B9D0415|nr:uroporphyrinogen-III C-methyltransferase [Puia sp.]HVU96580.1 uroporphyrinogen-III C-methyltransferase [Puia sp.]